MLLTGLLGFAAASGGAALARARRADRRALRDGHVRGADLPHDACRDQQYVRERGERAKAIGTWGAVTGLGVAVGPVTGGLLLSQFSWRSVFVALVPVGLLAAVGRVSRRAGVARPGRRAARLGRACYHATVAIGALVYTIIEAPGRGWGSAGSLAGFAVALSPGSCSCASSVGARSRCSTSVCSASRAF